MIALENLSINMLSGFLLSAVLCACALGVLSNVAYRTGWLLDKPSDRKHHVGSITQVGGVALFITAGVATLLFGSWSVFGALSIAAFWLVLVGLIDDAVDLSSSVRFMVQICAVLIIVYFGDIRIESVGRIVGSSEMLLGSFAVVFTVVCTLGVINAVNMIDGLDGLSSGITMMTLVALAIVANGAVETEVLTVIVSLVGALIAFFAFNMGFFGQGRKIFMGDAGSTFLGFILAWLFISLSQNGEQPLSPVVAGWLFGLPLIDSISVMMRRILNGSSPFKADRQHIHHQLQAIGYSARSTLGIMLSMHFILLAVGVMLNGNKALEPVLFWVFVVLVLGRHFTFSWLLKNKSASHL